MLPVEALAVQQLPALLEAWIGTPAHVEINGVRGELEVDLVARAGGHTFIFEIKGRDDVASLDRGRRHLRAVLAQEPSAIGVLVTPFMGSAARAWLSRHDIPWADLAGNADIRGPGLRVLVQGHRPQFQTRRRRSNAFGPKASRIARAMLRDPERSWSQAELESVTQLSRGYVSKVVRRLLEDDLLTRLDDRSLAVHRPGLLLDAWAQAYTFNDHHIVRLHRVGRGGRGVLAGLAEQLAATPNLQWAATGLSAAWLQDGFADFRLTSAYISRPLLGGEMAGLRPVDRGENVWLAVPTDEGVFDGVQIVDGVPCVAPVQTWLDLADHPERASEAAAHLRSSVLGWATP